MANQEDYRVWPTNYSHLKKQLDSQKSLGLTQFSLARHKEQLSKARYNSQCSLPRINHKQFVEESVTNRQYLLLNPEFNSLLAKLEQKESNEAHLGRILRQHS
jgi:hypothetical protein